MFYFHMVYYLGKLTALFSVENSVLRIMEIISLDFNSCIKEPNKYEECMLVYYLQYKSL